MRDAVDSAYVRTTLDIDEDVLQAAKELARSRGATTGQVLSELAREGLRPKRRTSRSRNGVPLLPARPGEAGATMRDVNRLRDRDSDDESAE
jgi:hypothetical protein